MGKPKQQGGLLQMAKFREILRLHALGYGQCAIAQSCAVARSTVQDYIRRATAKNLGYEQLSQLSDSAVKDLLGKGKRKVSPQGEVIDFAPIELELRRKGVTLALLWQEGLDQGQWHMSYGTFCRRYNQWRIRQQLSLRQVYKGGEKLFVDYCGLTLIVPIRTSSKTTHNGDSGCGRQARIGCRGSIRLMRSQVRRNNTAMFYFLRLIDQPCSPEGPQQVYGALAA